MNISHQVLQIKPKKSFFSSEEDSLLTSLVNVFGTESWYKVSIHLKNRTPRQCRERWEKYLSPYVNVSPWTNEEDMILLRKVDEIGKKWSEIRNFLTGRSDIAIRNRYTTLSKQRINTIHTTTMTLFDDQDMSFYEWNCTNEDSILDILQ